MRESKTDGSIHRYPTKFWLSSPSTARIYGEYHFLIGNNAVGMEDLPEDRARPLQTRGHVGAKPLNTTTSEGEEGK